MLFTVISTGAILPAESQELVGESRESGSVWLSVWSDTLSSFLYSGRAEQVHFRGRTVTSCLCFSSEWRIRTWAAVSELHKTWLSCHGFKDMCCSIWKCSHRNKAGISVTLVFLMFVGNHLCCLSPPFEMRLNGPVPSLLSAPILLWVGSLCVVIKGSVE